MGKWIQQQKAPITFLLGLSAGLAISAVASGEVSHGEMAAEIRSAGYPCAHVLNVEDMGGTTWVVKCNSGTFNVSRDQEGNYSVMPGNE